MKALRTGALLITLNLAACAGLQAPTEQTRVFMQAGTSLELSETPFFAQEDYQCGPATLAMLLAHAGQKVTPDELVQQVYVPARQGSLQVEMLAAARRQGFLPLVVEGQPERLQNLLTLRKPVAVLMNLSLPISPQWHYAVVIGQQATERSMILRSGVTEREVMPQQQFLNVWHRSNYWGFALFKPEESPPNWAEAHVWLQSLIGLERVNVGQAEKAYATAVKQWPQEYLMWFGLANSRAQQKKWTSAIQAYRTAVKISPTFADGWNNLAESLWEAGQIAEARQAIDKAVALGGSRLELYQASKNRMTKRAKR